MPIFQKAVDKVFNFTEFIDCKYESWWARYWWILDMCPWKLNPLSSIIVQTTKRRWYIYFYKTLFFETKNVLTNLLPQCLHFLSIDILVDWWCCFVIVNVKFERVFLRSVHVIELFFGFWFFFSNEAITWDTIFCVCQIYGSLLCC